MADFDKNGKPIALLFDRKRGCSKMADFHENGKPIALLFDRK